MLLLLKSIIANSLQRILFLDSDCLLRVGSTEFQRLLESNIITKKQHLQRVKSFAVYVYVAQKVKVACRALKEGV